MTKEQILGVKIFYALLIVASGTLGGVGTVNRKSDFKIMGAEKALSFETYGYYALCFLSILGAVLHCILPSQNKALPKDDQLLIEDIDGSNNYNQASLNSAKKVALFFALLAFGSGVNFIIASANKYDHMQIMNKDIAHNLQIAGGVGFAFCMLGLAVTSSMIFSCSLSKNRYALLGEKGNDSNYGTNTPRSPGFGSKPETAE